MRETRPLIGVTVACSRDGRGVPRLALRRAYVDALHVAGGEPVLLPPGGPETAAALVDRLDGLLLPGGVDVHPGRYGEEPRPGLGTVDEELDALELLLARAAIARSLPCLGICRGQQVLNVSLGGSLWQDLVADGVTPVDHATPAERGRGFLAHSVELAAGSRLRSVLGTDRVEVNSFHHQAVRRVAPGMVISAWSADGVVEGLESEDGRLLAVQCHPEDLTAHGWARRLFRAFVVAASAGAPVLARS